MAQGQRGAPVKRRLGVRLSPSAPCCGSTIWRCKAFVKPRLSVQVRPAAPGCCSSVRQSAFSVRTRFDGSRPSSSSIGMWANRLSHLPWEQVIMGVRVPPSRPCVVVVQRPGRLPSKQVTRVRVSLTTPSLPRGAMVARRSVKATVIGSSPIGAAMWCWSIGTIRRCHRREEGSTPSRHTYWGVAQPGSAHGRGP